MATPYTAEQIEAGKKDEAERLAAQKAKMQEWRTLNSNLDDEPPGKIKKEEPFQIGAGEFTEVKMENGSIGLPHVTFNGGAKVSGLRPHYEILHKGFLSEICEVDAEGAVKYGYGNWKKGDRAFAVERLRHAMDHFLSWINGDRSEPHLAKAAWGIMVTMYFHKRHPEWYDFDVEPTS